MSEGQGTKPAAKVITVSDGVAGGTREDKSGKDLVQFLTAGGFEVIETRVVPDGAGEVAAALEVAASGFAGLIVTTGGTGFGPRDETPEGTQMVLEKNAPGMAEAMRLVSPLGRLSRGLAGSRGEALICNLPGSSKGAIECLGAVIDVIPHALDLLAGGRPH
jgi:molybdopterin adenylyltransferase